MSAPGHDLPALGAFLLVAGLPLLMRLAVTALLTDALAAWSGFAAAHSSLSVSHADAPL
jgi:hypothetical protein